jgi:hypothetical protein
MIVVDTSAWVEVLRGTGSVVDRTLAQLLKERAELAVTEVVVAELLAGANSAAQEHRLRESLHGLPVLPLHGLASFEAAAVLARVCRLSGGTLRGIADCLVAVPAIAAGASVLHADRDFDVLARHTPLRVEPV